MSIEWIKPLYTQQEAWLGEAAVFDYDRTRADAVERLSRPRPKRIVELGAGSGGTAVAMAERGNTVVAVELVAVRAANARRLAAQASAGTAAVVEADFYTYTPPHPVDVVCYWDGFGIGTDQDQQRLLRQIAGWLAPDGCAVIEVYQPTAQILSAGQEDTYGAQVKRFYDYDPLHNRFIDRWWHVDAPEHNRHQPPAPVSAAARAGRHHRRDRDRARPLAPARAGIHADRHPERPSFVSVQPPIRPQTVGRVQPIGPAGIAIGDRVTIQIDGVVNDSCPAQMTAAEIGVAREDGRALPIVARCATMGPPPCYRWASGR